MSQSLNSQCCCCALVQSSMENVPASVQDGHLCGEDFQLRLSNGEEISNTPYTPQKRDQDKTLAVEIPNECPRGRSELSMLGNKNTSVAGNSNEQEVGGETVPKELKVGQAKNR